MVVSQVPRVKFPECFIGIDVGGTNVKWVTLGSEHVCLATGMMPTNAHEGPEALIARVQSIVEGASKNLSPLRAIGLALPGRVDRMRGTTIEMPRLPGEWGDRPVAAWLQENLGTPIFLINDGAALTFAEFRLGAGRGTRTILGVTIGTGIGGGVVIEGSIHFGTDDAAGEIGHIPIDPRGLPCVCGSRGCVETIASAQAIARAAGTDSVEEVVRRARNGDVGAEDLLRSAGRALGTAIWAAAATVAPEVVVIGGGGSKSGEFLLRPLTCELHSRSRNILRHPIKVRQAELGPSGGAIGAALWAEIQAHGRDASGPARTINR